MKKAAMERPINGRITKTTIGKFTLRIVTVHASSEELRITLKK